MEPLPKYKGRELLKELFRTRRFELVTLNNGCRRKVPIPVAYRERETETIEPGWAYLFQLIRIRKRQIEKEGKVAGKLALQTRDIDLVGEVLGISLRTWYRAKGTKGRKRGKGTKGTKGAAGARIHIRSARRILLIALKCEWITPEEAAIPWVKFIEYEADVKTMKLIRRRIFKSKQEFLQAIAKVLEENYRKIEDHERDKARKLFKCDPSELAKILPVMNYIGRPFTGALSSPAAGHILGTLPS